MPKTQNSRCDWSKKFFPLFQPATAKNCGKIQVAWSPALLEACLSSHLSSFVHHLPKLRCNAVIGLVLVLRPSIEVFLISNLFFSSFVMFLQGKLRVAVPPLTEVLLTRRRRRKCRQQQVRNLIMKVSDYIYVVSQLQVVFPLYYSIPSLNFSI